MCESGRRLVDIVHVVRACVAMYMYWHVFMFVFVCVLVNVYEYFMYPLYSIL